MNLTLQEIPKGSSLKVSRSTITTREFRTVVIKSLTMANKKLIIKIVLLLILWFSCSSMNNIVGKQLLMQFEYPMTLTLVQLLSISIYSEPLLRLTLKERTEIPSSTFKTIILPLALGKFVASVSSHVSIWKSSLSYVHTVKASMPVFTVFLSRAILGETQPTAVYLSLLPIVSGVTWATWTEFNFDILGLLTALLATLGFSLQNIFSKQVLKTTKVHQFQLLATLGRLSLIMFFPFWLLVERSAMSNVNVNQLSLLLLDGLLNFLQNLLAFSVLKLISPLSYAVANATKRIAIITLSILMLKNPVSFSNLCGIGLAVFGVFLYNRAKMMEKPKSTLPLFNNNYI